jgi:glycerol-3-phosphate acyltransferase PlsX
MIRVEMSKSPPNKIAAAVLRSDMRNLRKRLDYTEYGGIPLLGINGSAIISHGRSNAKAIKNALRVARDTAESGVASAIANGIAKLGTGEGKQEAGV